MSQRRDEMLEWVLGEIGKASDEGISISILFERLQNAYIGDREAKDFVWQSLLGREDIVLGDGKAGQALRKLALDDILTLGLGDKTIRLRTSPQDGRIPHEQTNDDHITPTVAVATPPPPDQHTPSATSVPAQAPSPSPKAISDEAVNFTPIPSSIEPPKKRRGRPPKNKPKLSKGPQALPLINQPPRPRGRPPKVRPNLSAPEGPTPANVEEGHGTPTQTPQNEVTGLATVGYSSGFSAGDNYSPTSGPGAPGPSTSTVDTASTPQTPNKTRLRRGRPTPLKIAEFTSWEDMQRHAGVTGVYHDFEASQKGRSKSRFYGAKSTVLVFKSAELRDPQWLRTHMGSWVEPLAIKMAETVIQEEDTARPPSSKRIRADDNASPDEPKAGPKPKRKYQRKSLKPKGDMPTTIAHSEINVEQIASKRQSADSIDQSLTHTEGIPSKEQAERSVSSIDHGTEQPANISGTISDATVVQKHNLHNTPSDTPTSKLPALPPAPPPTFSSQNFEGSCSRSMGPQTEVDVGRQVQLPLVQEASTFTAHQRAMHQVQQSSGYGSQLRAGISPHGAYPPHSSVKEPTPLNFLLQTTHQNAQTYRSPYAAPSPEATTFTQSPIHPIGELSPSTIQDTRPGSTSSVSPFQGHSVPQTFISTSTAIAPKQVDIINHQHAAITSQPGYGDTVPEPLNGIASEQMVHGSSPRRGSFLNTASIGREEQTQYFSPLHVSPRQPNGQAVSPDPNQQVDEISKHAGEPLGASKTSSTEEKDAQKNAIEAALLLAESTSIPNDVVRLATVYEGTVGNLLLSVDKSTIEFFGLDQFPPQAPKLLVLISKMNSNPITSVSGSYPMELRISVNEDDVTAVHCFQFACTPQAYQSASNMRAKLVTAKIAYQFRAGELYRNVAEGTEGSARPYKCDKCGVTFKNKGGLEYHVTRSQTTCNPNHDPSTVKRRGQAKKAQLAPTGSLVSSIPENGRSPSGPGQRRVGNTVDWANRASSDSDDSILEWAEQHATTGLTNVYKPISGSGATYGLSTRKKPKVPLRSLAGEASMWEEIVREILPDMGTAEHSDLNVANDQYFQQIILNLVHGNGGLFPGDKGLWFAFVGAWLKRCDKSNKNIPESKFCRKAFEDLIDAGKLQVSLFTFRDKASRVIIRKITTVPGFDLQSTQFESMKMAIEEAHPEFYIPAENAPPDAVLSKLRTIARRQIGTPNQVDDGMQTADSNDPAQQLVSSPSDDEFIAEEFSLEQDSYGEDGISDEDEFQPQTGRSKRPLKRQNRPNQAMRKRWAAARAAGFSSLARDATPIPPSQRRVVMTQAHKPQPACNTPVGGWLLGAASLPNPETGAWDQNPTYVKQRAIPIKKPRLPEPITYMQSSNGAWSDRAFGHGVNPIFSRRPRGKEGSSSSASQYRRKVDNGFRPILYRGQDKRHLPVIPSRGSLASDTAISQSEADSLDREGSVHLDRSGLKLKNGVPMPQGLVEDEYPTTLTPKPTRRLTRAQAPRAPRTTPTKRKFALVDDDFNLEPIAFPTTTQVSRRTRTSLKAAEALDEIEMLGSFKPKELSIGASINPGLITLPDYFGLGRSAIQTDEQKTDEHLQSRRNLQFIGPKTISQSCDLSEGSWTYYGGSTSSQPIQLKWRDNTTFTMENLPYDELETETDELEIPSQPVTRYQKKRRSEASPFSINRQDPRFCKTRPQTALPEDFEGVLEDPTQAASVFDVQVAKKPVEFHRAEARKMRSNMTPDVERRFITAVITVQVLTGGLEGYIDWVLITNIFPEFSITFLTKTWGQLRVRMPDIVEHIAEDFRDAFPEAYKRNEVPRIDYDNLMDYDWNSLIDWVTTTINPTLDAQSVTLPANRSELEQQYHVTESVGDVNNWRDSFFGLTMAIYKRIDMASAIPSTIPLRRQQGFGKLDDLTLAKSWVRATAVTPDESWDQKVAAAKLNKLGLTLVEKALQALLGAKVLVHRSKGRIIPGRSYEASDAFAAPLRKHISNQQFIDALNFKRFLDHEFSLGKDHVVTVDYMANEGTLMCITSLQAHGHIKLHGVDVPMNKFGLTGGGYETKKIPREKLRFKIDMLPTLSYVYNHDIELLRKAEQAELPTVGDQGELPAWISITGVVMEDLWKRVLASISQVVTLRAGTTLDALKNAFTPTLEEWELKRFMEWGVELGIFERLHERIEGWTASEWWWLAVGRLCEI